MIPEAVRHVFECPVCRQGVYLLGGALGVAVIVMIALTLCCGEAWP